jgi:tetratricopeptide (TPR) repeat protein
MVIRNRFVFVALVLAVTLSLPALAQRRNNQQEQQAAAPAQQVGPMSQSQAEADAFNALQKEQVPANILGLSDKFLAAYPTSQLNGYVNRFRMFALMRTGRCQEAIAAGEKGLALETDFLAQLQAADPKINKIDKNSESFKAFVAQTDAAKLSYYQTLMTCSQQLNDAEKTIEWGQKALAQSPEDLVSLLTVSGVMAERPPAGSVAGAPSFTGGASQTPPAGDPKLLEAHMKKTEEIGKKALERLTAFLAGPGAALSPDQKGMYVSNAHQTLGLVYLHLKKYSDSQKEYLAAIAAKKDDPISHYRLGVAYAQDRKNDQAMESLAKSVFLKGVSEPEARKTLTLLYEAKNKSTQGMEEYIASAGAKINQ